MIINKKNFAIILAGCGSKDGTEIHESTMLMLSIKQLNCNYQCFSVNKNQYRVVNFVNGDLINQNRNIFIESARIARGNIKELKDLNVNDYDGIVLPGGLGAVMNLSTYFIDNKNYEVNEELKEKIIEFKKQNKVICATCIAPMILVKIFKNITITLGNDEYVKKIVEDLGNNFEVVKSGDICIDKKNKIITCPFYMLAKDISIIYKEAYKVIENAISL